MKYPSILIVDDDEDDLQFLRDGFEENGVEDIGLFSDVTGVLSHLEKRTDSPPKLIISDYNMPVISGLELLKTMKQTSHLKGIDVIILSTSNTEPHRRSCLVSGACGYYVKPISFDGYVAITKEFKLFISNRNDVAE